MLSCDPGEANSAYAVLEHKNGAALRLLEVGMVSPRTTIRNMTSASRVDKRDGLLIITPALDENLSNFLSAFDGLLRKHQPKRVVLERFMVRRLHTASIETVSFMNGALLALAQTQHKANVRAMPASEWKASFNKVEDLDEFYEEIEAKHGFQPHVVDAVSIGLFDITPHGEAFPVNRLRALLSSATVQTLH